MESECSLPCLQKSATEPYPEPVQSSLHSHSIRYILILFCNPLLGLPSGMFLLLRSGLYGGCSEGVPPIHFFQAEHRIQFRSRSHAISGLFQPRKGSSEARNFEVINGLQHVLEKWVELCKNCIACQGRFFEKETVTAPTQSSDSE
jgi:hypothetical protein